MKQLVLITSISPFKAYVTKQPLFQLTSPSDQTSRSSVSKQDLIAKNPNFESYDLSTITRDYQRIVEYI